jgi:hypothetical protein
MKQQVLAGRQEELQSASKEKAEDSLITFEL